MFKCPGNIYWPIMASRHITQKMRSDKVYLNIHFYENETFAPHYFASALYCLAFGKNSVCSFVYWIKTVYIEANTE